MAKKEIVATTATTATNSKTRNADVLLNPSKTRSAASMKNKPKYKRRGKSLDAAVRPIEPAIIKTIYPCSSIIFLQVSIRKNFSKLFLIDTFPLCHILFSAFRFFALLMSTLLFDNEMLNKWISGFWSLFLFHC